MAVMSQEEKDQLAQEHYGKKFDELDTSQKRAVGGFHGGSKTSGGDDAGGGGDEGGAAQSGGTNTGSGIPEAGRGAESGPGAVMSEQHHTMTADEKERIAKEHYQKSYDELDTNEKKAVGGYYRAEKLGHEGYQAMGHMGGTATGADQ